MFALHDKTGVSNLLEKIDASVFAPPWKKVQVRVVMTEQFVYERLK
jgi:hypothetical protein